MKEKKVSNQLYLTDKCALDLEWNSDTLVGHLLNPYLQNIGMLRIREGNGNPLQYSCLENPMDEGAWWAAVRGVEE